jgi:hypothetical protein
VTTTTAKARPAGILIDRVVNIDDDPGPANIVPPGWVDLVRAQRLTTVIAHETRWVERAGRTLIVTRDEHGDPGRHGVRGRIEAAVIAPARARARTGTACGRLRCPAARATPPRGVVAGADELVVAGCRCSRRSAKEVTGLRATT